ncbi:MAG TPA: hypothetical protein VLE91_02625 [Candidatus Saccharimonadales bacterium]|nr:hypothetical protein [Candidatus Saccharimonadales bacterium]
MGFYGKLEEKLKAQELRRGGLSYKEILLQIKVSKDTVSRWCRDIELTEEQKKRLVENKAFGQRRGSIVAAENKRNSRIMRTKTIFKDALKDLGKLSKRDRFMAGIALYAGEGDKTDGHGGFANSDPKLINFMMHWFRDFCEVPASKFRGAIWLHEGLDEKKAKEYWSKLTGIPIVQFHKTYIAVNKINSRKIRKNIHEYGVFAIKFSDSEKQRRIIGWISALVDVRIPIVH